MALAAFGRSPLRRPLLSCRTWSTSAQSTVVRTGKLFIDNEYVLASNGAVVDVVSPIDGQPFATIGHASASDVNRAVSSARTCFDKSSWPQMPSDQRASILHRVAASIREPNKLAELAEIETKDCGKPLTESEADIQMCADIFDFYADAITKDAASVPLDTQDQDFVAHIAKEPLGVVGAVSPWNFPLQQAVLKIAPALAAGCAIVAKPSPLASLTTCALGEILAESGLPPGACNIVTGGPPDMVDNTSTGQCLIDHPLLDKLSFTGSGAAGVKMLQASAAQLRPTSLELGGKSAFLVFEDAEPFMDALVDWVMIGIFLCQGQVCTATSRILVHENLKELLTEKLVAAAEKIKVGDPMLRDTQMGPVVSATQHKNVMAAVKQAHEDGCIVHSPELHLPTALQTGFFVPPTILTSVPEASSAWRDEIFGPVLAIRSFQNENEAIEAANASSFGLANAVFSADAQRCSRVAARLKSGVVWENCSQPLFTATPMGGFAGKKSGFGHEMGVAGLSEYYTHKTIISTTAGHSWNWYGLIPPKA